MHSKRCLDSTCMEPNYARGSKKYMGGGCLGGPELTPGGVFKFCSSSARNTVYVCVMVPTTNTAPTHHGGVLLLVLQTA